jgi:hypothetical protein
MSRWNLIGSYGCGIAIVILLVLQLLFTGGATHATSTLSVQSNDWVDTRVTLPSLVNNKFCIDNSQPNIFLVAEQEVGTVAYNWVTRERRVVSAKKFDLCGPNGLLFAATGPGAASVSSALRFSIDDPTGGAARYMPTDIAHDGTLQMYTLGYLTEGVSGKSLISSLDGGLHGEERGQQFKGTIEQIAVSYTDAQSVYALVAERKLAPPADQEYGIYFSPDAGLTWELRTKLTTILVDEGSGHEAVGLSTLASAAAPVDTLIITVTDYRQASNANVREQIFLSADGGRTMSPIADRELEHNYGFQLLHTHEGILRWQIQQGSNPDYGLYEKTLDLSTDGGRTWTQLPVPIKQGPPLNWGLSVVPDAPASVFLWGPTEDGPYGLYYSADGGHTWRLDDNNSSGLPILTPYFPLRMLNVKDNKLYVREAPVVGKTLAARTVPNNRRASSYFPETGHNLSGAFRDYWQDNGGLVRQGYPLTEPFYEVSDTNGEIYRVQYFERAVFELHPEHGDPRFRVLLSQLGTFQYEQKYPDGAPGQTPNTSPGSSLFRETGKHLGGRFLDCWQRNGGLMQQGYPVSDEFEERSDLDGKVYTVQYFERAVFELHPEHAGTPYEVLMSQLGTFRLRAKYGVGDSAP